MSTAKKKDIKIPNIIITIIAVLSIAFGSFQLYAANHFYDMAAFDETCENEGDREYYSTHPEKDKVGTACKYAAAALTKTDVISNTIIAMIEINTGIILLAILFKK